MIKKSFINRILTPITIFAIVVMIYVIMIITSYDSSTPPNNIEVTKNIIDLCTSSTLNRASKVNENYIIRNFDGKIECILIEEDGIIKIFKWYKENK